MKNLLQITSAGEDLLGTVDDGTNRLFINDTEIASSQWTGTGSYTGSFSGHTITIAKIADTSGNVAIRKTGTYTYELYDQKVTEYLPLTGGTLTGDLYMPNGYAIGADGSNYKKLITSDTNEQIISHFASANGAFLVSHGEANKDSCFRATRTDTGVSLEVGVGSGGINHGVYSSKLGKWLVYADASNVYLLGVAQNVSGTVAVDHGGTGATSASGARSNLGATHNVADSFSNTKASINCSFINMSAEDTIDNVSLPRYAKGIQASNSSQDATMLVIDTIGTLYTAFRNNGTWSRAKKYGSTSLWTGTLASSAVTITNGMKYDRLLLVGQVGTNPYYYKTMEVPTMIIGTSDQRFEIADDSAYVGLYLKSSGNNVIMTRTGGTNATCTIYRVIGIN